MARASTNSELKAALTQHREETEGQIERLQKVFELIGKPVRAKTCEAINGLIEEAHELFEDSEPGNIRDAGIVACAQAIEHYEIARYGALIAWAKAEKKSDIVAQLQQTLDEEKKTDSLLTKLGLEKIIPDALKAA